MRVGRGPNGVGTSIVALPLGLLKIWLSGGKRPGGAP
jgi:hypothetical protein